jgi:chemotaxis signal transduction protein
VLCGPWALAFPFSWARNLIEDIELSDVPHAPAWLLGAANVDGAVIPVFDLARWLDSTQATEPGPGSHVLVGGEGERVAGLIFRGLPTLVKTGPGGIRPGRSRRRHRTALGRDRCPRPARRLGGRAESGLNRPMPPTRSPA